MLSLPKAQLGLYDTSVFFEMRAYGCSLPDQAPANRESRAVRAADVNIIVQTPDRGLMSDCIEQYIIRLGITVKVGCSYQCPAAGKDWPSSGPQ